jgi:NTE family protein
MLTRRRRILGQGKRSMTDGTTGGAKPVELALQGGGAHGAFTWGVLERLLDETSIEISALSGTSAGAMNAVVFADGLAAGGRRGAKDALERFWRAVSEAGRMSPIQRSPIDILRGDWDMTYSPGYVFFDLLSRLASPYDLNWLDLNPLRDLVGKHVDFARLRSTEGPMVFVTATSVRTGRPRVFRRDHLTLDAVMASACLPFLFKAVEIDDEAYWDGGYMGNPALFPLVDESPARDLVVIQINPIEREDVPRSAQDILNRINEITFNASLIKDMRAISLISDLVQNFGINDNRYRCIRVHRIFAEKLGILGVSSKLNSEWAFLQHLRELGQTTADGWLRENLPYVGTRSSIDLDQVYGYSYA